MEGRGRATVYAGGWSDYRAQRGEDTSTATASKPAAQKPTPKPASTQNKSKSGLSFTEKHKLEELPNEIDRLTAEIAKLEELMADPELFTREPVKFKKASEALVARQTALAEAEDLWLELSEKAEAG
jgi:ATP-binding cassette subfamily F protein uup